MEIVEGYFLDLSRVNGNDDHVVASLWGTLRTSETSQDTRDEPLKGLGQPGLREGGFVVLRGSWEP